MEPEVGGPDTSEVGVLVVEDTESIRRLLRINLEFEGYWVREASDGQAALHLLSAAHHDGRLPAIVVLDAQMAPRDGWWAVQQIRATEHLNHLPVIMVTAQPVCEDRERLRAAGVDACVRKPFDPQDLLALIVGYARHGRDFAPPR